MTQQGRQRSDSNVASNFPLAASVEYGNDEWKVRCYRGQGRDTLDLTDLVTDVQWLDNGPIMTGSINVQLDDDHPRLDISEGHIVRLFWRRMGQGGWQEVWTMRLGGALEKTGGGTGGQDKPVTLQEA